MNFGGYRLISQLGAGADGISYRASPRTAKARSRFVTSALRGGIAVAGHGWPRESVWRRSSTTPRRFGSFELALDDDPPHLVMEWAGTTTLAAAAAEKSRRRSAESRVRPGRCRCSGPGSSTGARPWQAGAAAGPRYRGYAAEAGLHRTSRSASPWNPIPRPDNCRLSLRSAMTLHPTGQPSDRTIFRTWGRSVAWLVRGVSRSIREGNRWSRQPRRPASKIALELMATDPADRPTAKEVEARLARFAGPDGDGGMGQAEPAFSDTMVSWAAVNGAKRAAPGPIRFRRASENVNWAGIACWRSWERAAREWSIALSIRLTAPRSRSKYCGPRRPKTLTSAGG